MTKVWHASSDGPDWTDVRTLMNTIEGLNECTVSVTIGCGGRSVGTELVVQVLGMSNEPFAYLEPGGLGLGGVWPNPEGQSLPQLIFSMLYKLDDLIEHEWAVRRGLRQPG